MFHGCRRWVCSLVCAFCILSMLFLDTCIVEASSVYSARRNITLSVTLYPSSGYLTYLTSSGSFTDSGTISSTSYRGSGSVSFSNTSVQNGYFDVDLSIPVSVLFANTEIDENGYYRILTRSESLSTNNGSVVYEGLVWNNDLTRNVHLVKSSDILTTPNGVRTYSINALCNFHLSNCTTSSSSSVTYNLTLSFETQINTISESVYAENSSTPTYDYQANQSLNNIESSSQAIQDSVTSDTGGGLLATIKDFFGSFFDNLLGIFVPEDGYFSIWFDRVNTLLSAKLGMLYAPFDLVISTLQAIYSADSIESGIPFPGIKWEDTWLVEPFTFTFASLGDSFDDLRDKVYFATDTVLVLTFLMLLQSKVKLILEGYE